MLLAPFISRIRRRVWIWVLGTVGATLGLLPDLLGAIGILILHDRGRLYNSAHSGSIRDVIQYIPMCWLHLRLDPFMHDPELVWEGIYVRATLEVMLWLINAALIWWYIRIWRKNRPRASRNSTSRKL
jgi:hypothetical protein